ncbi:nucleotide sugar dehydrogenase [Mesorhizobium sp. M2D.F.Ca.ET.185.01.1.1]|uniref:nucleotide sugar dehydrogenase n=1 Tax=unclassified Mesorhizobium TaxID=325217 RepID=UPI000FCB7EAD|nr:MULTISPECIES: nucleotide sugar dehydrogenase [unclassified Mesorhizobium]TGP55094.1 nucleotide sugar dehydrogenase [bacterium M00.F.Ca.ET.230.01.1.1]TGP73825.1 nucleotide sugar dehydrogenase [bacterium M00.F.Ca.ET.227.01.1.1]TGP85716.1 nucleotide sugar dehydrogenase [bacterium M00.F.Ca.ET.221.01.1.1]TGP90943.1 nucleotide sugar dehydrogenase [bacterium M00.F.Ca.ET.222.01.1.1]TGT68750.1 nucleotide sugar dehydrogenase [bacterium M00.F.Ca.ET.159.01.1.1]TGT80599.1 nucleotide sugar dehydrogenase
MDASRSIYDRLLNRISTRSAQVGVIGLGYVGLPLAVAVARAGFSVSGFDIEAHKVESLNNGQSYIEAVTSTALAGQVASGRFRATADFAELAVCEVIIICVPTPLTKNREPDLSFVRNTAGTIAKHLRPGQLVVLESTTYPGTTDDVIKPILEETGLRSKIDFFLGFSPEREDPGNRSFEVATIPKVVAGDGIEAATLVQAFYHGVVKTVVPVSSTATAEAVKLTENIFRSVNIALVNELKVVLGAMGIDIWEVIEAAKSKPFGYMPFYPGPGLGGHCVPIDPFYLTWKAREYELPTRFIELAAEINTAMPRHVVDELAKALDRRCGKALSRSRILIVGLAYKKNVPDIRESPSLRLIELIEDWGGKAEFHDPHVTEIPTTREHMAIKGRRSIELTEAALKDFDAVVVATDHDAIDYQTIADHAPLIVDTRNVFGRLGLDRETVVKA